MTGAVRAELTRLVRFGALGICSSLISIGAYALLAPRAPLGWAWSGAYLLGIVVTTCLSDRAVFSVRAAPAVRLLAFFGYLTVFALGLGIVWFVQSTLDVRPWIAGAASVAVTAPLNYGWGRRLFRSALEGSEDEVPVDVEDRQQPEPAR